MSVLGAALEYYLRSLAEASRFGRRNVLVRFFVWCGVSGDEAVAFQRMVSSRMVEFDEELFNRVRGALADKIVAGSGPEFWFVDAAYNWFRNRNIVVSTKRNQMGIIRGFFVVNRAGLPEDKVRFKSDKEPVGGLLEYVEFKRIAEASNPKFRAMEMISFVSGSGVGEFFYINTHRAEKVFDAIRKGADIICLDMPGRKQHKNKKPYYTFVGGDAVDCLRTYFHSRGWVKDSVLFRNAVGYPVKRHNLQNYFKRKAFETGLIKRKTPDCLKCGEETVRKIFSHGSGKNRIRQVCYVCVECQKRNLASKYNRDNRDFGGTRYRIRWHELRDLFKTEMHRASVYAEVDRDVADFFMGHEIDPLKYDKIMRDRKFAEEQYRKALPFLNILSEDPRKVDRVDVEAQLEASRVREEAMSEKVVKLERDIAEIRAALDYRFDLKKHKK